MLSSDCYWGKREVYVEEVGTYLAIHGQAGERTLGVLAVSGTLDVVSDFILGPSLSVS